MGMSNGVVHPYQKRKQLLVIMLFNRKKTKPVNHSRLG